MHKINANHGIIMKSAGPTFFQSIKYVSSTRPRKRKVPQIGLCQSEIETMNSVNHKNNFKHYFHTGLLVKMVASVNARLTFSYNYIKTATTEPSQSRTN